MEMIGESSMQAVCMKKNSKDEDEDNEKKV